MKKSVTDFKAFVAFFCLFSLTIPAAAETEMPQDLVRLNNAFNGDLDQTCVKVIDGLKQQHIGLEEMTALFKRKIELEDTSDDLVTDEDNIARASSIAGAQLEDRIMFELAKGDSKGLTGFVRPKLRSLQIKYDAVLKLGAALDAVPKGSTDYSNKKEAFIAASKDFGVAYGQYLTIMQTLLSVASGHGVIDGIKRAKTTEVAQTENTPPATTDAKKAVDIKPTDTKPTDTKPTDTKPAGDHIQLVFDLTQENAVNAAIRTLRNCDPSLNSRWFTADFAENMPSLQSVKYVFNHNPYALIGKLEQDQRTQKSISSAFNKVMYAWTKWLLNASDMPLIPSAVRPYLLKLISIDYDTVMLKKYLGKVQEIVNISRRIDKAGNLVAISSDYILDLQLQAMLEYMAQGDADDFYETFARIAYHTKIWAQIAGGAAQKATALKDTDKQPSNKYFLLVDRLRKAEKSADNRELPYTADPATSRHLMMLAVQMTEGLGVPWIIAHHHQFFNYVGNIFSHLL